MRMPAFWSDDKNTLLSQVLAPFGWLYGRITLARLKRRGERLSIPVIAIGNFTIGGAGKTPVTLAIAAALTARGMKPFIITRGYGGTETGPYRVDHKRDLSERIGDEPLMMAQDFPVIVSRDRAAGGKFAEAQGADVILLDDALQNPDLAKDFTLGVMDGGFGIGNGSCLPAGPLRAPLAPMLQHCDAVLIIGADTKHVAEKLVERPVFHTSMQVKNSVGNKLRGQRVLAFCGIGRPSKFGETLMEQRAEIAGLLAYADHHPYSDEEATYILGEAARLGAKPVTTAKDAARLGGSDMLERLKAATLVVPIGIALPEDLREMLYRAVDSSLRRAKTASGEA